MRSISIRQQEQTKESRYKETEEIENIIFKFYAKCLQLLKKVCK